MPRYWSNSPFIWTHPLANNLVVKNTIAMVMHPVRKKHAKKIDNSKSAQCFHLTSETLSLKESQKTTAKESQRWRTHHPTQESSYLSTHSEQEQKPIRHTPNHSWEWKKHLCRNILLGRFVQPSMGIPGLVCVIVEFNPSCPMLFRPHIHTMPSEGQRGGQQKTTNKTSW